LKASSAPQRYASSGPQDTNKIQGSPFSFNFIIFIPMSVVKRIKEQRNEAVVHAYHDHSNEVEKVAENPEESISGEEGFPYKLHYMLTELETDGMDDVVSWQPHGRCFLVHNQKAFVEQVLPL
jgi:hypothetical protein